MSYYDQGGRGAYEAYLHYLYQRRQDELIQVQLSENRKKNSELTGRYIVIFTIIIVFIGLVARFLYRKCERDNREISCRSDFRHRQPLEFTEAELVNEQPIRTLNPNRPKVQIPHIHRNRATTVEVRSPTAPSLHEIPSNSLTPTRNNQHASQDPPPSPPPSYDDCVKNLTVMQTT